MRQLAEKTGCEIKEPILAGNQKKGSATGAPALKFLEQHLYRSGKYARGVYQTIPEEISLHTAGNPGKRGRVCSQDHLEAGQGERLALRGNGCDCRRFKNLCQSCAPAFARYEIPVFVVKPEKSC